MEEKFSKAMKDEELEGVDAGVSTVPVGGQFTTPAGGQYTTPAGGQPTTPYWGPGNSGPRCSVVNELGAVYVCPRCGRSDFKIFSANSQTLWLRCYACGTEFSVANI